MSFGAAFRALSEAPDGSVPPRQLEALDQFLNSCNMEKVVVEGDNTGREERKHAIRLVAILFTMYEAATAPQPVLNVVDRFVPNLLSDGSFFPKLFKTIVHQCREHDIVTELLKLVYTSLFSVIPDSSPLIIDWFNAVVQESNAFAEFSPYNRSLALLTSIQFLNVSPSMSVVADTETNTSLTPSHSSVKKSYRNSGSTLAALHTVLGPSSKLQSPVLRLTWALVLHQVALKYMAYPDTNTASSFLKPTLQVSDGVHFDFVARDALMAALEQGGHSQLTGIIEQMTSSTVDSDAEREQYSQTVADLAVALLGVCKATVALARTLRLAISPWPKLQDDVWQSDFAKDALTLAKTKCPAGIEALIELARSAPKPVRVTELAVVSAFVGYVPSINCLLREPERGPQSISARTQLDIFPARLSDGQGAITVDAGTHGTLLSTETNQGPLVLWQFQYNGWSLLGRVLENADQELGDNWTKAELNLLALITETAVPDVLQALSAGLERGDIVELVALRLASWLKSPLANTVYCVAAINFLSAVAREGTPIRVKPLALDLVASNAFIEPGIPDIVTSVVDLVAALTHKGADAKIVDPSDLRLLQFAIDALGSLTDVSDLRTTALEVLRPFLQIREVVVMLLGSRRAIESICEGLEHEEGQATMQFATELVDRRRGLNLPFSDLESMIYHRMSKLLEVFLKNLPGIRAIILQLLASLVHAAPPETPLLAFVSDETASELLSTVERCVADPLESEKVLEAASRFFDAVARSRQQGLFIFLCKGQSNVVSGSVNPLLPTLQNCLCRELLPSTRQALLKALAAVAMLHAQRPRSAPLTTLESSKLIAVLELEGVDSASVSSALSILREQVSHEGKLLSSDKALNDFVAPESTLRLTAEYTKEFDLIKPWSAWLGTLAKLKPQAVSGCAETLLQANLESGDNSKISEMLVQRTNMAFFLLNTSPEISSQAILRLVLTHLADPPTDMTYDLLNANLRIVNFVLRNVSKFGDSTVLEILDVCVVRHTRDLCTLSDIGGLSEVLAVLRQGFSLLSDKGREMVAPLGQAMVDAGVHRALTRVYSLADPNDATQVTAAELVLLNIFEWLPIGIVADHFAGMGLLTVLLEAPISRRIQHGGIVASFNGKQTNPSGDIHAIWRRALLPILLRFVAQLGPRIAQEVSYVLVTFGPQVKSCLDQWRSTHGRVSLALIEETILIYSLVVLLRKCGTSSNVESLLPKDELVAALDHLLSHRKYLGTKVTDDESSVLDEMAELRTVITNGA